MNDNLACYNALAEAYAARAEQTRGSIRATLHEYMFPLMDPHSRFIDVGCAVGVATEEAALAGHLAVGLDISPEMIAVCKRDRKAGSYIVWDYMKAPLIKLDAMLAFAFVHLYPKVEAPVVLEKMRGDLRRGGLLYLGTTVETESREGWEQKNDYKEATYAPPRYRARYTTWEFEQLVLGCGFELELRNEHRDAFGKLWRDLIVRRPS
jgi:SAM-dependent methyltransferase